MPDRYPSVAPSRLRLVVLLAVVIVGGCERSSPVGPDSGPPTISGYVYRSFTADTGEPPLADVVVTVRDATGVETTALTDSRGFYSVRAAMGLVVVTAAKTGYETGQSRFDVTESTVLNFGLRRTID
jgi:hypothetical protein